MSEPILLRISEVAELLAIGESKVYELIRKGLLPALRVDSVVRVPRAELDAWVAKHVQTAAGEVAPEDRFLARSSRPAQLGRGRR